MKEYQDKLEKERVEKRQTIKNINGKENIMKPYNYEKAVKSYRKESYRKEVEHDHNSTYKTARLIAKIISGIGWVVIGYSVLALFKSNHSGFADFSVPFCLAGIVVGLILIIQGQLTRVTIDNADSTAEMLAIMKSAYVKDISGNSENPET